MTATASSPRRIALVLEYHGANLHGSQLQKHEPSVQSELEAAILRMTGERSRVAFAGRTDAGVHAIGQVGAFTTSSRHRVHIFERGLNALLPRSIAVRHVQEVDPGFDPRRRAAGRTYCYTIYNAPQRSPLCSDRAWHVRGQLDIGAMRDAAALFEGEHDFAAFSRREATSTVRRVLSCGVEQCGPMLRIEMQANAFLRHQVRRTVGALVQVGLGKRTVDWVRETLTGAEPATGGPVAPAHGLVLVSVAYPDLDLGAGERYHECLMGLDGPTLIAGTEP